MKRTLTLSIGTLLVLVIISSFAQASVGSNPPKTTITSAPILTPDPNAPRIEKAVVTLIGWDESKRQFQWRVDFEIWDGDCDLVRTEVRVPEDRWSWCFRLWEPVLGVACSSPGETLTCDNIWSGERQVAVQISALDIAGNMAEVTKIGYGVKIYLPIVLARDRP